LRVGAPVRLTTAGRCGRARGHNEDDAKESYVEVKIGVQDANRELVVESSQSRDEVVSLLRSALVDADGVLELSDERGRTVLVPTAKLAYLELGEDSARRVGFGNR
jgi:hypothetical protein